MELFFILLFGIFAILAMFLLLNFFLIGALFISILGLFATIFINPIYTLCGLFILASIIGIKLINKRLNKASTGEQIIDSKTEKVLKQGSICCKIVIAFSSLVLLASLIINVFNIRKTKVNSKYYREYVSHRPYKMIEPNFEFKYFDNFFQDFNDYVENEFENEIKKMNDFRKNVSHYNSKNQKDKNLSSNVRFYANENGVSYDYNRVNNNECLQVINETYKVNYCRENDKELIYGYIKNGNKNENIKLEEKRTQKAIYGYEKMLKIVNDKMQKIIRNDVNVAKKTENNISKEGKKK